MPRYGSKMGPSTDSKPDDWQWLTSAEAIASALENTAVGEGEDNLRVASKAAAQGRAELGKVMRQLAADLRAGVKQPLPTRWSAKSAWSSAILALVAHGCFQPRRAKDDRKHTPQRNRGNPRPSARKSRR